MDNIKYSDRKVCFTHHIGDGKFGITYRYDDIVIKRYFNNLSFSGHIKEDIFNVLKDVKEKAFIDLIDYSTYNILQFDGYEQSIVSAYSSKYVKKVHKKSIDMPMDYTINTMYEFLKLAKIFNSMNIEMDDTFGDNIIVSKDNLVIVDPDFYKFNKNLEELTNLKGINNYIVTLWCNEYGISEEDDLSRYVLENIFYEDSYDDYLTIMEDRLNEKTPRDLIRKTLRRK